MDKLAQIKSAYVRFPVCCTDSFLEYLKVRWHYEDYPEERASIDGTLDWIQDVVKHSKCVTGLMVITTADVSNRVYDWFGRKYDAYCILTTAVDHPEVKILFEVDYEQVCVARYDSTAKAYRFDNAVDAWDEIMEEYD